MVITRKIEVFVCEDDKALRKAHYEKLYGLRNDVAKAANAASSARFATDFKMPHLPEEERKQMPFVGCKGKPCSKQNVAYVVIRHYFPQLGSEITPSLAQYVTKNYEKDLKAGMWKRSLRSYKENIPVPFPSKSFADLRFSEYEGGDGKKREGCFFSLMGVPFQMRFGSDRSGNRLIVERVVSGEYKLCTSSIQFKKVHERLDLLNDENKKQKKRDIDVSQKDNKEKKQKKKKQKIFLHLCVDIPNKELKLDEKKTMYAYLGVMNPIVCTCDVRAYKDYDSGYKFWEIGTKEEFNYRRRQIQEAVRRCQINNRYSVGGKGRKRKCQAIERWHEKELNYIDTKLHTYSRMLVDLAVKHGCGKIMLLNQKPREDKAKEDNQNGEPFVLRNWSYYGFKEKIAYKCKMVGIKLCQDKETEEENE